MIFTTDKKNKKQLTYEEEITEEITKAMLKVSKDKPGRCTVTVDFGNNNTYKVHTF